MEESGSEQESESDEEAMEEAAESDSDYFDDDSNEADAVNLVDLKQLVIKIKRIVSKLNRHKELLRQEHESLLNEIEENFEELQFDERFGLELDQIDDRRKKVSLTSLKKSIPVRWYSVNRSFKSVAAVRNAVNSALIRLGSLNLTLSPEELRVIDALIVQLDEIERFSKRCSTDQVLNSSFLIELTSLKLFFHEENDALYDCEAILNFRRQFRLNIDRRVEVKKEHVVAFLLDPQGGESPILDEYLRRFTDDGKASTLLISELTTNATAAAAADQANRQDSATIGRRREALEMLEQRAFAPIRRPDVNLAQEINSYLNAGRSDLDPAEYWVQLKQTRLGKLFRRIGCIQLTSIKSEQTWSKTGYIHSKRRASLSSSHLS